LAVSLLLHLVWTVLFSYLIIAGPFDSGVTFFDKVLLWTGCEHCLAATDSISTAYEMGRLELVSISLTILGVVIAFSAFSGFFLIRSAAMNAAAEEAVRELEDKLPQLLASGKLITIIQNDDRLRMGLANALRNDILEDPPIDEASADEIAGKVDDEN
jgi:hypothetical protein